MHKNKDQKIFKASLKRVAFSPGKLMPIADLIRGKKVMNALQLLHTFPSKRAEPFQNLLKSAIANTQQRSNELENSFFIKSIQVNQGPRFRYYKAGAMGRATILRRRFSHITLVLDKKEQINN